MFDHPSFDQHERVVFAHDAATGLRAIVAVHSSVRGPAAGGCRFWHYSSTDDAIADTLRLSRGMSYKNAMAGLPLGGGKAVVMVDADRPKTQAMLEAFGRLVESLQGQYITAEDVGASVADMEIVAAQTRYPVRLTEIFARSTATHRPTSELADEMARQLLAEAR